MAKRSKTVEGMTPEVLLEHEEAWYKHHGNCTMIGSWSARLKGKRLTIIVYRVKPEPRKDPKYHLLSRKVRTRLAVAYGERMITSVDLED
jgi:hypothetical protein